MYKVLSEKPSFQWLRDWNTDKHFKRGSSLIGGWPRPLEFYLETLQNECKSKEGGLKDVDIGAVLSTTVNKIQNRYRSFSEKDGTEDINYIMAAAISNIPIARNTLIHPKVMVQLFQLL